jgi:hypothetical protein
VKVSAPTPAAARPRPTAPRPVATSSTSVLDKVLAIVAMIVSLASVGSMAWLFKIFLDNPPPQ